FGWEVLVLTPRASGGERRSKQVVETGYRDILQDWKARLGLDSNRTLHEQFGLPLGQRPGSVLPHTRLLTFMQHVLTYPDRSKGWIPFAVAAVEEIHRQNPQIDAIVTTSPPISCHLIGR